MPLRRLTCALGVVAAAPVGAIGFGALPAAAGYGQPLDLVVPLRLEAGEVLPPGCLRADVVAGPSRLPAEALALRFEPAAAGGVLRLRSTIAVHEPVIEVTLTVGCSPAVSRRFVVLADPPAAAPPARADAQADAARAVPATAAAAPSSVAVPPARPMRAGAARPGPTAATATAVPGAPAAALPRPGAAAPAATAGAGREAVARPARLQIDEPEIALQTAALAVARQDAALAQAAQSANAAQAAASAAQAQLATMQAGLLQLQGAAEADRRSIGLLREHLAQADSRNRWQPLSWGLVALLALSTVALGWRLRQQQQRARVDAGPQPAAPTGDVAQAPATDPVPMPARTSSAMALRPSAEPQPLIAPVAAGWLPAAGAADEASRRAVSVDELLDLEQQAEFFVVLGEEEAAVDLLLAHLRSTGGTSPLPYLKLLEIYRRRGDHEAYERTRSRFNRRFNGHAPGDEVALDGGRELLDYPRVLEGLQRAWPLPLDAMALLESLLFRHDGGEVFDLPAYRDVLMLYAVARDAMRQAGAAAPQVDVLLPLQAGPEADAEVPYITAAMPGRPQPLDERATAPVDLDLGAIEIAGAPAGAPAVSPGTA